MSNLREHFPQMIAQIDRHGGILPYDTVAKVWGEETVNLAIDETKVMLVNLWWERPGADPSKCTLHECWIHKGMGVATFSWDQEWPTWLLH